MVVAGRRAARALALAAHGLRVAEAMGWGRVWSGPTPLAWLADRNHRPRGSRPLLRV